MLGTSQPFLWPHTALEWQLWGYCTVLGERAPFSGTWRTQRWLQITARGTFELTGMDFLSYHTVVFEEKPVSAAVHHWETETARTGPKMDLCANLAFQVWIQWGTIESFCMLSGYSMRESVLALGTLCIHIISKLAQRGWYLSQQFPLGNLVWYKIPEGRRYYTVIVGGLLLLGKAVCASHERYIHAATDSSLATQNPWKERDLRLGVGTSTKTSFVAWK